MVTVAFYFDLLCPWAYQASKWIREVRTVRDLSIDWRFFSLEESSAHSGTGTKHPWEREWSWGWSPLRLAALLRRHNGSEAAGEFYAVAGRHLHDEGLPVQTPDGIRSVLKELGLGPDLLDQALTDETTTADVLADHRAAVQRGVHGVPTLILDDKDIFFGPALITAPQRAAAGELWDAVHAWTTFPDLYELQRPKVAADRDRIRAAFAPYLRAVEQVRSASRS